MLSTSPNVEANVRGDRTGWCTASGSCTTQLGRFPREENRCIIPAKENPGSRPIPAEENRERARSGWFSRSGSVAGACGPGRLSDSVGRFMPRKIARERGRASLVGLARSRVRAEPGRLSDWVSGLPVSRWTHGSLF
jgi:hypothetical protein